MNSSISTYLVLVTAAFSVTYLGFLMYSAFGLGALQAAAPFIGTISLVFGEWGSRVKRERGGERESCARQQHGLRGGEKASSFSGYRPSLVPGGFDRRDRVTDENLSKLLSTINISPTPTITILRADGRLPRAGCTGRAGAQQAAQLTACLWCKKRQETQLTYVECILPPFTGVPCHPTFLYPGCTYTAVDQRGMD